VQTVNVEMMKIKQDVQWHGKQQEKGNYCYIDLLEEDFEECEWEVEEREQDELLVKENAIREENEEAERRKQMGELKTVVKEGADDSIREEDKEDEEDKKFPMETRVKDEEIDGKEDVDRIQEYVVTELKEAKKKKEEKILKMKRMKVSYVRSKVIRKISESKTSV